MEVQKNDLESDDEKIEVEVPNLIGLNLKDAKEILKDTGLEIECESEDTNEDNISIGEQIPRPGIKIKQGNKITVKLY